MLRLTKIVESPALASNVNSAPRLRLSYDERVKSRLAAMLPDGTAVAVLLPRGSVLRDGTVLGNDEDQYLVIEAAPQPVTRVRADTALALMRAVYHLANRHVPVQLNAEHVLIERDAVLERMLLAMGAIVEHDELPFDPEGGAYHGNGDAHGHHHHHDEIDDVSATVGEQLSIEAHKKSSK